MTDGDAESKCNRGDSAVSKLTEDSGVVATENGEVLPGEVLVNPPGLLGREVPMQERPTSSDILEELQKEGIIPLSPSRETANGQAYTIMLDESDATRRRPPARLESLKVKRLPSKEEMEEKMRLADERRKLREDELTARLRSKSARARRATAVHPSFQEATTDEQSDHEESPFREAELFSNSVQLESDPDFPAREKHDEIF
ncbi:stathmin domain-containing protein 1 isoform X2 [Corythoichthys intestinalis]|uniref:stathmin domain-containing protein 1 isoform X2 n=1 Tax=Corythoichthys intestinalis TaxID=161448 RepID=UPI0025A589C2|nr:stathmin domain-containing protein 1 isoform X2 [Corythoichthys intestinalis]